jgi:transposase
MPKILSPERVIEYSVEFKIKVVKLTFELDVKAIDIAKVLNLHPIMIYRWRQEYREGKFVEEPSRRISMTKDTS